MKQYNKNILLFLGFVLMFACTPEKYKVQDFSHPYVATSPNVISQGDEMDFVDCSQGVVSRTWTIPSNAGIVQIDKDWNVISNNPSTSNEQTIFLLFNEAGSFQVRLQATFKDSNVKLDTLLAVTVVPYVKASFTSDAPQNTIFAGNVVNYENTSTGFATNNQGAFTGDYYQWTFEGGSPSSSTAKTPPPIQYDYPGSWDVTLVAYRTSPRGRDTLTVRNYLTVLPEVIPSP